ncbi:GHMP family kinase ATP-binding protein [Saccharothrix coeruleofusca]|uniref:Kinase n=1 Tax=Saccharothrix coeruleofusca TaxID=33919 RepID=A0A918APT6_9PSEU|nr:GHMP kinase [Saccharothrix coeruleofusca]GGP66200.1 kinase [Saccharothrix coeruleofusca]
MKTARSRPEAATTVLDRPPLTGGPPPAVGRGRAACHHGELLQGCFPDGRGGRRNGLVTLPVAEPATHAEFRRDRALSPSDIRVDPPDRTNTARAAALAVAECARRTGQRPDGGRVLLRGGVPVGVGMGSSTSDLIAAVRAVADSYGTTLPARVVAAIAVRVETASDPLMLDDRPLLFAQREGTVIEVLGDRLPPLVVVSCLTGGGAPVDTAALPSDDYDDEEVEVFAGLRADIRRAIRRGDPELLGRVCTRSARLNQRRLPKPELPLLIEVAERAGAVGVQVAHSGNVAGVLFAAGRTGAGRRANACADLLGRAGIPITSVFTTSGS